VGAKKTNISGSDSRGWSNFQPASFNSTNLSFNDQFAVDDFVVKKSDSTAFGKVVKILKRGLLSIDMLGGGLEDILPMHLNKLVAKIISP